MAVPNPRESYPPFSQQCSHPPAPPLRPPSPPPVLGDYEEAKRERERLAEAAARLSASVTEKMSALEKGRETLRWSARFGRWVGGGVLGFTMPRFFTKYEMKVLSTSPNHLTLKQCEIVGG